jgi:ATP-binding protein involved in chromosome partitioning
MSESLQQRIAGALARVRNPRLGRDVVSAEQVHDVATTTDGKVRLTLVLDPADDATLVRDVRQAVEGVSGVADVRVDVADPQQYEAARNGVRARQRAGAGVAGAVAPSPAAPPPAAPKTRALPVMDAGARPAPSVPAAPTPVSYPKLGKILAVSSGKGRGRQEHGGREPGVHRSPSAGCASASWTPTSTAPTSR